MSEIRLKHIDTIPYAQRGYELYSHSITINGDALHLYKKKSKLKIFGTKEFQYKIIRHNKRQTEEILLPPSYVKYPLVDVFSDGSFLLVDARCQYRGLNDFDLNAIIYNPHTQESHQFLVGDGVEQISIDHKDNIWVSYFDEGIFGNYGWGNEGSPSPMGVSGLNCFDTKGNLLWGFDQTGEFICDCYALNVTPEDTHIFYYTDFDFCTITEGFQTKFFSTELEGCHAFAISGNHLLFTGQYQDDITKAYLVMKEGDSLNSTTPVTLTLSHGETFSEGILIGKSKKLHLFTKTDWYAIDAWDAYKQTQASN